MKSAIILIPPSTDLSGNLLSNIPEGPEYETNIISMHGKKFYQLHTETMTAVVTSK